jgi:hypothetical protein
MFFVGVDLGQSRDHTAIAVVERLPPSDGVSKLAVRRVERVALGTPYPLVAERVRTIVRNEKVMDRCFLTVDATGVGAPVVEMLRGAELGCEITAVTITSGDREHGAGSQSGVARWNVPKQDLISGVQVLLERGELRISRGVRDVAALVRELLDMRALTSSGGRLRMGAEGCGEHDDLVIALALACWRARRVKNGSGNVRLLRF